MPVQDVHVRSLATSTYLSKYYVKYAIAPEDLVSVLNASGISFVLVGTHGNGGWMDKPRATQDVDFIVASRHLRKTTSVLLEAYPQLVDRDSEVVCEYLDRDAQKVVVKVIKPVSPLFRETFKHVRTIGSGLNRYRLPSLEMAITLKFASMTSESRSQADVFQDAHDVGYMVISNSTIDREILARLGNLIRPGGGREVLEVVRKVRAGEKLNV